MKIRDMADTVVNRLHFLDDNLLASFYPDVGGIQAILVDDRTYKGAGVFIPIRLILELRGHDAVYKLAQDTYEDLKKKLDEANNPPMVELPPTYVPKPAPKPKFQNILEVERPSPSGEA